MSGALIAAGAVAAAIALVVGGIRISMRLTERKSDEDLKREMSDNSFYESNIAPGPGGLD